MRLRIARHTKDLAPVIAFYSEYVGLQVLGSFNSHDGYDGVFLGFPLAEWHLEFTVSAEAPVHIPDEDDLLVFYCDEELRNSVLTRLENGKYYPEKAKNPYWDNNGTTFTDPDGYRIVIAGVSQLK